MSSIPEEMYLEILLRSPVKSLLVCKSVCKNWYSLITSSDFVNTHLNLTTQKSNPILMLEACALGTKSCLLYSIGYDSLASSSIVGEDDPIDAIEMDYPLKSLGYHTFELWGSSNGLICVRLLDFGRSKNLFCVWNPATREYKQIQPLSAIESYYGFRLHAFGYDHKTDDYKLLIGVEDPESMDSTIIYVYRLASNSWKTGKTIPYLFPYDQKSGVSFNGDLHWLPLGQDNYLLLSLDISDETFKEMQLPKELKKLLMEAINQYMYLGMLEECLCVLVSSDNNVQFEVWEMLDYGVRESWTKRYVIAHESIFNNRFYFKFVLSSKNGVILFLKDNGLVLYDLRNGSAREPKINNIPILNFQDSKTYIESLVSLNSGTYVRGEDDRKINGNTKKAL